MPATVRPASEADLDALVRLNDAVQSLHAELYPDEFKEKPDAAALRAFFAARLPATALKRDRGERRPGSIQAALVTGS